MKSKMFTRFYDSNKKLILSTYFKLKIKSYLKVIVDITYYLFNLNKL